jgi:hypothetical protein
VFNNPLSYVDPTGYWSLKKLAKGIGGALGGVVKGIGKALGNVFKGIGRAIKDVAIDAVIVTAAFVIGGPEFARFAFNARLQYRAVKSTSNRRTRAGPESRGGGTPGFAEPIFGFAADAANESSTARQAAAQAEIDELITMGKLVLPRTGASMDELAREVLSILHPISIRYRVEIGAWIFEDGPGGYVIRSVHVGNEKTVPVLDRPPAPAGAQGAIHTHWNDALFSDDDLAWVYNRRNDPPGPRLPLYVSRGGKVYACDPGSARCNDRMIGSGNPRFKAGRTVGDLQP